MAETHASLEQQYQKIAREVERLLGRKEEAVRNLDALKASCLAKGIDPENLSGQIQQAEEALAKATSQLAADLEQAERDLQDILNQLKDQ